MLYLAIFAAFCFPFGEGDDIVAVNEQLTEDGIALIERDIVGLTRFRISEPCERSVAGRPQQERYFL